MRVKAEVRRQSAEVRIRNFRVVLLPSNFCISFILPRMQSLKASIERLAALGEVEHNPEARPVFLEFRDALTQGKIRAAEKIDGRWMVNAWVKHGILLGFRLGELVETGCAGLTFVDKDTFPARKFSLADRVRIVPGGSSVRLGAYVAPSVICMPPMFINVGAYVDEGSHDRFACAGGIVRAGRQARTSKRSGADWRRSRAGKCRARNH